MFTKNKFLKGLTKNTFLLTFTSLFADISTEMLYPVLPIFLTTYLGAPGSVVGLIEGIANATQNIQMGVAGYISDKLRSRKILAVIGYLIAAVSKPFIGISQAWQGVFAARFMDRFGTGTRSAPRDALIATSTTREHMGKAFGLEGIGDNLGAFLGPVVTILLIYFAHVSIRAIFYLAVIPGILAVLMVLMVKEKKDGYKSRAKLEINFSKFPRSYYLYLFAIAIFGIGNISSSFMILQTKNIGVPLIQTILIYALFNLVASFVSYPSGVLSDKFGRKIVILISFVAFIVSLVGFAISKNLIVFALLFGLYGVYQGIFRSVGKAYAADFVTSELEATSIGWFQAVVGLTGLIASLMAGLVYDKIGHSQVFIVSLVFVVAGAVFFLITELLRPNK